MLSAVDKIFNYAYRNTIPQNQFRIETLPFRLALGNRMKVAIAEIYLSYGIWTYFWISGVRCPMDKLSGTDVHFSFTWHQVGGDFMKYLLMRRLIWPFVQWTSNEYYFHQKIWQSSQNVRTLPSPSAITILIAQQTNLHRQTKTLDMNVYSPWYNFDHME